MSDCISDDVLKQHKIIIAVVFLAIGVALQCYGLNGMITFLTGAAGGFIARELFGVTQDVSDILRALPKPEENKADVGT